MVKVVSVTFNRHIAYMTKTTTFISDCGELEISAGDYFNEHKYKKDNI